MTNYWSMLGERSNHADEYYAQLVVGVGYDLNQDTASDLYQTPSELQEKYVSQYMLRRL